MDRERAYPPPGPVRQPSKTPLLATHAPVEASQEPDDAFPDSLGANTDDDETAESSPPPGDGTMTPLDNALEKIGMGRYQYQLLVLCGMGWAMDNMALQTISVILPRVQEQFQVGDRFIGLLSTSIFSGMMVSIHASDPRGQLDRKVDPFLMATLRSAPGAGEAVGSAFRPVTDGVADS